MLGTEHTAQNLKMMLDLGADPTGTSLYERCDTWCLCMVCIVAPLTLGCSQLCCGPEAVLKKKTAVQVARRHGATDRTLVENAAKVQAARRVATGATR